MPITPTFRLEQNDDEVILHVHAPLAKVRNDSSFNLCLQISDTEVEYCAREIYFHSRPYYLRVHLCNDIDETSNEQSTAYDADTGRSAGIDGRNEY